MDKKEFSWDIFWMIVLPALSWFVYSVFSEMERTGLSVMELIGTLF